MTELCPACAIREIETPSGFCAPCVVDRATAAYAQKDREQAERRLGHWRQRSSRPNADLMMIRKQRSRTLARIKPTSPLAVFDPWGLAIEALDALRLIARATPQHKDILEGVSETLRRLAWGPDEDTPQPASRSRRRRQIPGQLTLWEEAMEVAA